MTALVIAIGYLAGSIPAGYWIVRAWRGVDIRTIGSGNIGASNVWRKFGRRYGIPVVLLDVAKGFGPALAGSLLVGDLAGVLAGGAAMLGHWRPLFLRFEKGGKTVVTNRLTGNFPGSPIELEFVFTLKDDKIVSLEILS